MVNELRLAAKSLWQNAFVHSWLIFSIPQDSNLRISILRYFACGYYCVIFPCTDVQGYKDFTPTELFMHKPIASLYNCIIV